MSRKTTKILAALLTVCVALTIAVIAIAKPKIVLHGDFVEEGYGCSELLEFEANVAETNKFLGSNDFLKKVKNACIHDQELVKTWKRKEVEFRFENGIGSMLVCAKIPTYSMQIFSFRDVSYHVTVHKTALRA
jgi:hypothetical protein